MDMIDLTYVTATYWSIGRPIVADQNDSEKIEIVLNSFIQVVDTEFSETKIHKDF